MEERLKCLIDRIRGTSIYGIGIVTNTWEGSFEERIYRILIVQNSKGKIDVKFEAYLSTFACIWSETYGLQLVSITSSILRTLISLI